MKQIKNCERGDIVRLIENQVSIGDHKRHYQAGHQFEFMALIQENHQAVILVKNITNDRARLMFPVYALEFVCSNPNCPPVKKVKPVTLRKAGVA